MNGPILLAYATKRGSTREVAEAIAEQLQESGLEVEALDARTVHDLSPYPAVILGSALYLGRMHIAARRFLREHDAALAVRPFAVFGMGPLTNSEHDLAESRKQVERSLVKAGGLSPFSVAIFGGVVVPEKLGFPFSRMKESDARDWEAIAGWVEQISARLAPAAVTS